MTTPFLQRRAFVATSGLCVGAPALLAGCATAERPPTERRGGADAADLALLNRITWGVDSATVDAWNRSSRSDYIRAQLEPSGPTALAAPVQAQIAALSLRQKSMTAWVLEMDQRRRDADAIAADDAKKAAQQAYQQDLNRLAREAATESLLLALYSPQQLSEQLTWFWFNHFNVHQYKANLRARRNRPDVGRKHASLLEFGSFFQRPSATDDPSSRSFHVCCNLQGARLDQRRIRHVSRQWRMVEDDRRRHDRSDQSEHTRGHRPRAPGHQRPARVRVHEPGRQHRCGPARVRPA